MTRLAPVFYDHGAEERLHHNIVSITPPIVPSIALDVLQVPDGRKLVCDAVTPSSSEVFPDADTTLDVLVAEFANAEEVFMSKLNSAPIHTIPDAPNALRKITVFIDQEPANGSASPQLHKRKPSGPLDVVRNGVPRSRENSKGASVVTRGRENSRDGEVAREKKQKVHIEGVTGLRREVTATKKRKSWNTQNVYEMVSGQQAWNARFRG
jgi:hypothetical protein